MKSESSKGLPPEATVHADFHRVGFSPRAERRLNFAAGAVTLLLVIGWIWSFVNARDLSAAAAENSGGMRTARPESRFRHTYCVVARARVPPSAACRSWKRRVTRSRRSDSTIHVATSTRSPGSAART